MNDQPKIHAAPAAQPPFPEPGVPQIRNINWAGTWALYAKEVRRFLKVQLQTVWAPAITTLMFLVIFIVALGGSGRTVLLRGEAVPFADFIAPGLIIMGMINACFANASFALMVGKVQGTLVDYLMPPIAVGELLFALVASSVTRAMFVGFALWLAMALWPGVHVTPAHLWAVAWFGLLGTSFIAFLGVLTSIWAEKFDHGAAITNFVIGPLALLSGTFYSIDRLPPVFQAISHANPFFYIISGFRYGFVAAADTNVVVGSSVLLALNLVLGGLCYALLKRGWKIKA
ncbi:MULTISPECIES: ABC transporter permease [Sphingomonadaceae]|uniref:Transport permease protein n=1 Tax=Sphingomonas bisphenolicum TaxID=296544 RepID=A0ABN5WDV4_9SPHN|nr:MULTISPECIES: ABC transporter permease [Sphingomonadaceae]MBA4090058.1 multidrug ABC transporter permease [Sphingobium sp.]MBZ9648799.1 ABC transporter permease [Sphingobium sp. 3R8]BBF70464.1 transport permease protein [Sphingomonas bisphenolicum]